MKKSKEINKFVILYIKNIKKNYIAYSKYLSDTYYNNLTDEFLKYDFSNIGVDSDINIIIENKVQADLCKIANYDLDILILLVEKYIPIIRIILRKLDCDFNDKLLIEDTVIESIYSYDGSKLFSMHALDIIKEKLNNKIITKKI